MLEFFTQLSERSLAIYKTKYKKKTGMNSFVLYFLKDFLINFSLQVSITKVFFIMFIYLTMSLKKIYISNKFSNKFSKHSIFCHTVTFIMKPYIFNETPVAYIILSTGRPKLATK